MRLSLTRWFLFVIFLFAWLAIGGLVMGVDPDSLNSWGRAAFFGLLFLGILSGCTLGLLKLSERFVGTEGAVMYQSGALRQGSLLAGLGTALALGQYFRVLTWWNILLMVAFILLLELTVRQLASSKR